MAAIQVESTDLEQVLGLCLRRDSLTLELVNALRERHGKAVIGSVTDASHGGDVGAYRTTIDSVIGELSGA
ncbi:hypothetical protein [Actinomadura sp. 3N407]|uniref:hypothetical protein n=1 Tax=Actinomadura sp. 3N407 TaxID=3457423 RepID=UPI003FCC7020